MPWNQLQYTTEKEIENALSDLVTVASRPKEGGGMVIGTAFPIFASDNHTMMLTAAHVIEFAFKKSSHYSERKDARSLSYLPGSSNKPYKMIDNWINETDDLWCLIAEGKEVVKCNVIGICLRPPLDMALLILDTSHLKKKTAVFQINSDILNVGDKIVLTSFKTSGTTRDLVAKQGIITEVKSNGALVNAPVYQTNIPIEAGASGGPVFKFNGDFYGTKDVVGVVSSDFSPQEAFENPKIDGCSYISIICSATPLQVVSTNGETMTFQDMCNRGLISDIGSYIKKVKLTYFEDGNWSQTFPK
ncbi:trypsin-like peptidase domain-containing protein [Seonamhaeicola aphaedonensis]|uniref:Trypsin-like peptidase n=1 Tax=Seonamhaeicola aphaedonensis TaxID=1461338 RepID=A0A3D9HHS3_9FLAO|nr:trypsin-like peptidase domain-containing protein [Seonamhaeicola aphaedonensis]RED48801.1 trypsin-like peptidase [Seonamhaeicola aphaedonensis]